MNFHQVELECAIAILWSEAAKSHLADPARAEECNERLAAWRHHASNCGVGLLKLKLEEILQHDPKRESEFLHYIALAEQVIRGFGERVPAEWMKNTVGITSLKYYDTDVTLLIDTLEELKRLIVGPAGTTTTATTSPG